MIVVIVEIEVCVVRSSVGCAGRGEKKRKRERCAR
jgi:hypothetical protein